MSGGRLNGSLVYLHGLQHECWDEAAQQSCFFRRRLVHLCDAARLFSAASRSSHFRRRARPLACCLADTVRDILVARRVCIVEVESTRSHQSRQGGQDQMLPWAIREFADGLENFGDGHRSDVSGQRSPQLISCHTGGRRSDRTFYFCTRIIGAVQLVCTCTSRSTFRLLYMYHLFYKLHW